MDPLTQFNPEFASSREANRYVHRTLSEATKATNPALSRKITVASQSLFDELERLEDLDLAPLYVSFARPVRFVSRDKDAMKFVLPKLIDHFLSFVEKAVVEKHTSLNSILSAFRVFIFEMENEMELDPWSSLVTRYSTIDFSGLTDFLDLCEAVLQTSQVLLSVCIRKKMTVDTLKSLLSKLLKYWASDAVERLQVLAAKAFRSFFVQLEPSKLSLVRELGLGEAFPLMVAYGMIGVQGRVHSKFRTLFSIWMDMPFPEAEKVCVVLMEEISHEEEGVMPLLQQLVIQSMFKLLAVLLKRSIFRKAWDERIVHEWSASVDERTVCPEFFEVVADTLPLPVASRIAAYLGFVPEKLRSSRDFALELYAHHQSVFLEHWSAFEGTVVGLPIKLSVATADDLIPFLGLLPRLSLREHKPFSKLVQELLRRDLSEDQLGNAISAVVNLDSHSLLFDLSPSHVLTYICKYPSSAALLRGVATVIQNSTLSFTAIASDLYSAICENLCSVDADVRSLSCELISACDDRNTSFWTDLSEVTSVFDSSQAFVASRQRPLVIQKWTPFVPSLISSDGRHSECVLRAFLGASLVPLSTMAVPLSVCIAAIAGKTDAFWESSWSFFAEKFAFSVVEVTKHLSKVLLMAMSHQDCIDQSFVHKRQIIHFLTESDTGIPTVVQRDLLSLLTHMKHLEGHPFFFAALENQSLAKEALECLFVAYAKKLKPYRDLFFGTLEDGREELLLLPVHAIESDDVILRVCGSLLWNKFSHPSNSKLKLSVIRTYAKFSPTSLSSILVAKMLHIERDRQKVGFVNHLVDISKEESVHLLEDDWEKLLLLSLQLDMKGCLRAVALVNNKTPSLLSKIDVIALLRDRVLQHMVGLPRFSETYSAHDGSKDQSPEVFSVLSEFPSVFCSEERILRLLIDMIPIVHLHFSDYRALAELMSDYISKLSLTSEYVDLIVNRLLVSLTDRSLFLDLISHISKHADLRLDHVLGLCQSLNSFLRFAGSLSCFLDLSERFPSAIFEKYECSIAKVLRTMLDIDIRRRCIQTFSLQIPEFSILLSLHDVRMDPLQAFFQNTDKVDACLCLSPCWLAHAEFTFSSCIEKSKDFETYPLVDARSLLSDSMLRSVKGRSYSRETLMSMCGRLIFDDSGSRYALRVSHALTGIRWFHAINTASLASRVEAFLDLSLKEFPEDVIQKVIFPLSVRLLLDCAGAKKTHWISKVSATASAVFLNVRSKVISKSLFSSLSKLEKISEAEDSTFEGQEHVLSALVSCFPQHADPSIRALAEKSWPRIRTLFGKYAAVLCLPLCHLLNYLQKDGSEFDWFFTTLTGALRNRSQSARDALYAKIVSCVSLCGSDVSFLRGLQKLPSMGYIAHCRSFSLLQAIEKGCVQFSETLLDICIDDYANKRMLEEQRKLVDVHEAAMDAPKVCFQKFLQNCVLTTEQSRMVFERMLAVSFVSSMENRLRDGLQAVQSRIVEIVRKTSDIAERKGAVTWVYGVILQNGMQTLPHGDLRSKLEKQNVWLVEMDPGALFQKGAVSSMTTNSNMQGIVLEFGVSLLDGLLHSCPLDAALVYGFLPLLLNLSVQSPESLRCLSHLVDKNIPLSSSQVNKLQRLFVKHEAMGSLAMLIRKCSEHVELDERLIGLVRINLPSTESLSLYRALISLKVAHSGVLRILEDLIERLVNPSTPKEVGRECSRAAYHALIELPLPKGKLKAALETLVLGGLDDRTPEVPSLLALVIEKASSVEDIPWHSVLAGYVKWTSVKVEETSSFRENSYASVGRLIAEKAPKLLIEKDLASLLDHSSTSWPATLVWASTVSANYAILKQVIASLNSAFLSDSTPVVVSCLWALEKVFTSASASTMSQIAKTPALSRFLCSSLMHEHPDVADQTHRVIGFILSKKYSAVFSPVVSREAAAFLFEKADDSAHGSPQSIRNVIGLLQLVEQDSAEWTTCFSTLSHIWRQPFVRSEHILYGCRVLAALLHVASDMTWVRTMLPSVVIVSDKDDTEISTAAKESLSEFIEMAKSVISTKLDDKTWWDWYKTARTEVTEKRMSRKRELAEMAVADPARHTASKMKKNRKKDVQRKAKRVRSRE
eukprot:ANDGO_00332.mRNA.1 hypothetical protein